MLFCTLAQSASNITKLAQKSFDELVRRRTKYEVWLVMFTTPNCPACKHTLPKIEQAAAASHGMVKFGLIEGSRCPSLEQEFGIKSYPYFHIFHPNGDCEYPGEKKVKEFLNYPASYLIDPSEPVEKNWLDEMVVKPSAIYFGQKDLEKTPTVWSGIGSFFSGKSIRIGISKSEDIAKLFNITSLPTIGFYNGTHSMKYDEKFNFLGLKTAMEKFFAKKLQAQTEDEDTDFYPPSDFIDQCVGGRAVCILSVAKSPSDKLVKLQYQYRKGNSKIKWLVGISSLPYDFMNVGGVWAYNPRRDAFLHVESENKLDSALDRIIDGSARWSKRTVFETQSTSEL